MAMRDQPFLKLYVQDYLTDEKLNECSASAQGVYIKIMCLFHKSETYGGILLKQKFKQNSNQIKNFASLFARLLPFDLNEIDGALNELLEAEVLHLEEDFLFQKRMIKDGGISVVRSTSGSLGGKKTQENNKDFAKAKTKAKPQAKLKQKSEYEYEYEFENEKEKKKGVVGERKKTGFLQSEQLFETTDMHNQLPKGTSKQLAPIFVEMLEATGRLSGMEFDEMRKYFYNWAKFQAPKMLPQGIKTKAEEASAHFDRIRDQMKSDPEKFFQTALKPYLP